MINRRVVGSGGRCPSSVLACRRHFFPRRAARASRPPSLLPPQFGRCAAFFSVFHFQRPSLSASSSAAHQRAAVGRAAGSGLTSSLLVRIITAHYYPLPLLLLRLPARPPGRAAAAPPASSCRAAAAPRPKKSSVTGWPRQRGGRLLLLARRTLAGGGPATAGFCLFCISHGSSARTTSLSPDFHSRAKFLSTLSLSSPEGPREKGRR